MVIKTKFMCLDVASWWRVGIRRGCRGSERMGSRGGSEVDSCGGGGEDSGEVCWMSCRREERKVERGWQIISVE